MIRGAIYLFLGKTGNLLISSLQILLIPRLLGPASMGFYSYWLSVYFVMARILGLGGQHMIIKNAPEFRMKNNSMTSTLVKKTALIKLPVFLALLGGGFLLWSSDYPYFLLTALAALLFSLNLLGESVIYSFNWMGTYALIPLIRIASRVTLVIVLFYLFSQSGIIVGIFGAPLLAFLLSLFLVLHLLPRKKATLEKPFSKYFSFGFWIYLSVAIQGMMVWLVPILAEMSIQDMAVVGYFGVGVQICFSATLLIFFISESVLPSLVEFRIKDKEKFKDSLRFAWKYTNILLIPLAVGGFVLARPLVTFIIGKEYTAGTLIIKLFFPAIIFLSWIRYHRQILFVYEKKIQILLTQVINLLVFLGSWFYLIKAGQTELAPLSLSLGSFLGYLFILICSHKREKVTKYFLYLIKPLFAASLMGLVVNIFVIHSLIKLLGVIIFGAFLYSFFLILFKGVGKYDLELLKEFVKSTKISRNRPEINDPS